jgi:hypothetical protein
MPQPPVRMTLKHPAHHDQSYWERFKKTCASLSPVDMMKKMQDERSIIQKKIEKGDDITADDIEFLNKSAEEEIDKMMTNFKQNAMQMCKIEENDSHEEIKFKFEIQQDLVSWLSALFDWVIKKLQEIFDKIKEAIDWCFTQVKELFKQLFSFFE